MEILRKLHLHLLGLSILFSPFISSLDVHRFGTLGMEGSFYPAALGLLVWLMETLFFKKRYMFQRQFIFFTYSSPLCSFPEQFIFWILQNCNPKA